jgi:hypothetical protein
LQNLQPLSRTIHVRFRAATAVIDAASNSPPLQFVLLHLEFLCVPVCACSVFHWMLSDMIPVLVVVTKFLFATSIRASFLMVILLQPATISFLAIVTKSHLTPNNISAKCSI